MTSRLMNPPPKVLVAYQSVTPSAPGARPVGVPARRQPEARDRAARVDSPDPVAGPEPHGMVGSGGDPVAGAKTGREAEQGDASRGGDPPHRRAGDEPQRPVGAG